MKPKVVQRGVTEREVVELEAGAIGPEMFAPLMARIKEGWRFKTVTVVFERDTIELPGLAPFPPKKRGRR